MTIGCQASQQLSCAEKVGTRGTEQVERVVGGIAPLLLSICCYQQVRAAVQKFELLPYHPSNPFRTFGCECRCEMQRCPTRGKSHCLCNSAVTVCCCAATIT